MLKKLPVTATIATGLALNFSVVAFAEETTQDAKTKVDIVIEDAITVTASADASAEGLPPEYAGGKVAEGGRAGILGNQHFMDSPFSVISYTNELIQDQEARSVGDVLQNDPSVRVARGFGNFQESYFIRGFILGSDDIAYNGLYSLLPRQYIATELFERVEVLHGASAFLMGASLGGGGIGGNINLLPKRAPNEPLNRLKTGTENGKNGFVSADIARRFGAEQQFGVRVNAAFHDGESAIEDEESELGLLAVGLDWRGERVRLSADLGWQDNQLDQTRTNVTMSGLTSVLDAPDASSNWAQPWSYSNEKDLFGTLRGEFDLTDNVTAWAAYGLRRTDEANSLANLKVTDLNGDGTAYRFDNTREDKIDTGELGLRGYFETGNVGHEWVFAASYIEMEKKNAYKMDFYNTLATNLYSPTSYALPAFSGTEFSGNDLDNPELNGRTSLRSYALGDTLSLLDEQLLLTLGARYQTIKDESFAYNTGISSGKYDKSELSPAIGAVFKLNESWSIYSNYIESLKKGDTAPTTSGGNPVVNAGEVQTPYVSVQKEAGIKFDAGDLGMTLAYFTTDKPRSYVNSSNVYTTSGNDRHQGIELSSFGQATDSIKVLGGVSWLDAEQQDTGDSSLDGNKVIGIPKLQANLGAEWDIPGVDGLAIDGLLVYTGSVYADNANTLEVPSWTRFDMGARYIMALNNEQELTLRARVTNLFDKDYWASSGGYENNGYLVAGSPRSVTLTASLDF